MMINETRILNEFIELVSVPCPSKDEKAEADLLVQKLQGELSDAMAMCGIHSLSEINRDLIFKDFSL